LQQRERLVLKREIGLEDLLDVLADPQTAHRLEVGQAASRNRMRSASRSACFISSIDSPRS
jgi:hypothetical protein